MMGRIDNLLLLLRHGIPPSRLLRLALIPMIVGIFHQYDLALAVLILLYLMIGWLKQLAERQLSDAMVILAGMLVSMMAGAVAEQWGISNGYWAYHDLSGDRSYPYWVPFAYALVFRALYRAESAIFQSAQITSFRQKLMISFMVSALLPVWGEVIAISLGTWTYAWGWQFFGVPLLAMLLLGILHSGIFLLISLGCRRLSVEHPVFNPRVSIDRQESPTDVESEQLIY